MMYSDKWLKDGYTGDNRIKVSDIVDYRIWSDGMGVAIGVTVDYETADDFHYELLIADWHRFLSEVLCITDMSEVATAFQDFLKGNMGLFAFEDALDNHGIKYKKIAF